MNYFTIHRPSNLICGVIASSSKPADSSSRKFVPAPDKALSTYYRLLSKNLDAHIDIGHLMAKSNYVKDVVFNGRSGDAEPQTIRYRSPESIPEAPGRESLIFSWIASQPDADAWDLSFAFNLGTAAAKAYLTKYHQSK